VILANETHFFMLKLPGRRFRPAPASRNAAKPVLRNGGTAPETSNAFE